MISKKIQVLLALLFVGSASMLADGDDPFPEVPFSNWQGNMTFTAKVLLSDVELGENTIVAVYDGNQIRGKEIIQANKILSMVIGGDYGEYPSLHFKVYTEGRVIEVDQGLTYYYNGEVGSYDDPYIINLPLVTTSTSSEGWGTTCLPYNAAMPEDVTVYAAKEIDGNVLRLTPITGTILPKNTPVLLKTDGKQDVEWLSRVADGNATIGTNLFKGTIEPETVEAESVLTLGHANGGNQAIGFWLYTGTNIPANRAYLEKNSVTTTSRGLTLSWQDESTGIKAINHSTLTTGHSVYDLQGRPMVNGQRSLFNGQIRISNGKKYLVR